MKLAVGVPWSSDFIWSRPVRDMLKLERPVAVANRAGVLDRLEIDFFFSDSKNGWCPARRHAHVCEQALDWGADLILILGADQRYERDLLVRLLARWEQGCDVISALVPSRCYVAWQPMQPFQSMAWRIKPQHGLDLAGVNGPKEFQAAVEVIDPTAGDLQEINFIGSGVLMFHRDHLLALRKPWFAETYNEETMERLASMDAGFVWRLQLEAGARVWVDTTIRVKHIHPLEIDETYPARFADWALEGVGDPSICSFRPPMPAAEPQTAAA